MTIRRVAPAWMSHRDAVARSQRFQWPQRSRPGGLLGLALALFLAWLIPAPAAAQSAAERAAQLNSEGKALWKEQKDVAAAAEKFRQATLLSPEGRYYFNLCYALHQLGRYRDAMNACQAVERNSTDEALLEKAAVVIADLEQRLPAEPPPPPPEDPTTPDDTQPDSPPDDGYDDGQDDGYDDGQDGGYDDPDDGSAPGPPPPSPDDGAPPGYQDGQPPSPPSPLPELERVVGPSDDYKWSLGGSVGVLGASVGREDMYSGSGVNAKFDASFLIVPGRKIGLQGYIGISQIDADLAPDALTIYDFGGAAFKHIRRQRFYVTPLVGAQLTVMQTSLDEAVATAGVHGQVAFSWILGYDRRHVLSVAPALNLYLPASGLEAEIAGLDQSAATFSVSVGYTLRFMTPFGQSPLIILE